jgi:endonuclease/exonuclease/phosphatase family metal-dependent hydrolase
MRLVSYNILDGGVGRADPLGEVIEAARPDVIALVEADDDAVIQRLADRFHMDLLIGRGRRHSVALLSAWPIGESINHASLARDFDACLLEVTLEPPGAAPLPIGVIHLHAHATDADEQTRQREITVVLNAFARHRAAGTVHLLCGDFNSNAPTQQIDLARAHSSTQKEAISNGGVVPRRVIEHVLRAGYVDTLRARDAHYADTTGSFTTQHPQQRVDYIFAHSLGADAGLRIADAWIEQDRLARYASDHFPVGVEIHL